MIFISRIKIIFELLGASIDRPDRSPVVEESETNVDMCPDPIPEEPRGPKLKKMLSLEGGKESIKQMKKVIHPVMSVNSCKSC